MPSQDTLYALRFILQVHKLDDWTVRHIVECYESHLRLKQRLHPEEPLVSLSKESNPR